MNFGTKRVHPLGPKRPQAGRVKPMIIKKKQWLQLHKEMNSVEKDKCFLVESKSVLNFS